MNKKMKDRINSYFEIIRDLINLVDELNIVVQTLQSEINKESFDKCSPSIETLEKINTMKDMIASTNDIIGKLIISTGNLFELYKITLR